MPPSWSRGEVAPTNRQTLFTTERSFEKWVTSNPYFEEAARNFEELTGTPPVARKSGRPAQGYIGIGVDITALEEGRLRLSTCCPPSSASPVSVTRSHSRGVPVFKRTASSSSIGKSTPDWSLSRLGGNTPSVHRVHRKPLYGALDLHEAAPAHAQKVRRRRDIDSAHGRPAPAAKEGALRKRPSTAHIGGGGAEETGGGGRARPQSAVRWASQEGEVGASDARVAGPAAAPAGGSRPWSALPSTSAPRSGSALRRSGGTGARGGLVAGPGGRLRPTSAHPAARATTPVGRLGTPSLRSRRQDESPLPSPARARRVSDAGSDRSRGTAATATPRGHGTCAPVARGRPWQEALGWSDPEEGSGSGSGSDGGGSYPPSLGADEEEEEEDPRRTSDWMADWADRFSRPVGAEPSGDSPAVAAGAGAGVGAGRPPHPSAKKRAGEGGVEKAGAGQDGGGEGGGLQEVLARDKRERERAAGGADAVGHVAQGLAYIRGVEGGASKNLLRIDELLATSRQHAALLQGLKGEYQPLGPTAEVPVEALELWLRDLEEGRPLGGGPGGGGAGSRYARYAKYAPPPPRGSTAGEEGGEGEAADASMSQELEALKFDPEHLISTCHFALKVALEGGRQVPELGRVLPGAVEQLLKCAEDLSQYAQRVAGVDSPHIHVLRGTLERLEMTQANLANKEGAIERLALQGHAITSKYEKEQRRVATLEAELSRLQADNRGKEAEVRQALRMQYKAEEETRAAEDARRMQIGALNRRIADMELDAREKAKAAAVKKQMNTKGPQVAMDGLCSDPSAKPDVFSLVVPQASPKKTKKKKGGKKAIK